jgi:hypothetical protein
MDKK